MSWRSKYAIEMFNTFLGGKLNQEALSYLEYSLYDLHVKRRGKDVFRELKEEYKRSLKMEPVDYIRNFKQFLQFKNAEELSKYRRFNANIINVKKMLYEKFLLFFNIDELIESYPILNHYRYKFLEQLIKISATKFKMNYKVKFIDRQPVRDDNEKMTDRGNLIDMHYEMVYFQNIFKLERKDDNIILNFNTPLGKLIIHNMLIVDTDWMPIDALKLSKNAYFMYKRFILNKVAGKHKAEKIELKYDEIAAFLDYKWKNESGVNKKFEESFDDMKENGLILNYKRKKRFKSRIYELHFEKKKPVQKKKEGDEEKGLKMIA